MPGRHLHSFRIVHGDTWVERQLTKVTGRMSEFALYHFTHLHSEPAMPTNQLFFFQG